MLCWRAVPSLRGLTRALGQLSPAGLQGGWWNAGVMLPLSGEERDGLGSGKWAKTSNWATTSLSQRTRAQEAAKPGQVRFPKPRARGYIWASGPTLPACFLYSLPPTSPPIPSPWLGEAPWRQSRRGVTWSIGFGLPWPLTSCVALGK